MTIEVGMKVEIHCHTNAHSLCSRMSPAELVAMAEACGYDALFLTDHGKIWTAKECASLRELCSRVKVLPGIEIALPDGYDLLVLGADNPLYESLVTPSEVLAQACADGYLTVLAHPFRRHDALPEYARLVDAIEVRSCNHPLPGQAEEARRYAREHNIAEIHAGDAHGLNFLNKFWIETTEPFETPLDLRRLILLGHYENRSREIDGPLPPEYKAATMAELSGEDLPVLLVESAT
jgi:3',5'-nucleoside bisphosphate phosphatase